MKKRFLCVLCLAAAAVFANGAAYAGPNDNWLPRATPEEVGMSSERLERLNEMVQRHIDDELLAGAVTLVARKGKVVHFEAHGDNWREENQPMTTDAIFVIMSMTKPIVSVALMMLYEEGLFLLDDPISKWLPEFADKKVLVEGEHGLERVPAERSITIRHVLTHTAGVDPNRGLLTDEERRLLRREETLAETYKKRGALPLNFQPGENWQYGSSTDYVALLVEKMSGIPLDRYLKERIFEPLGMHDTHYNVPESKTDRVAAVYRPSDPHNKIALSRAPGYRKPTQYFPGTYGLSSTAADYWRFHQMMLNGGELNGVRILSPKTVNLMITNHVGDKLVYIRGPGYGFGLGYSVLTDPGKAAEPLTPGSFSWGGAWGTVFWVDPAEDVIGVFMTQITSYSHLNVRPLLGVTVTQAIVESYQNQPPTVMGYQSLR